MPFLVIWVRSRYENGGPFYDVNSSNWCFIFLSHAKQIQTNTRQCFKFAFWAGMRAKKSLGARNDWHQWKLIQKFSISRPDKILGRHLTETADFFGHNSVSFPPQFSQDTQFLKNWNMAETWPKLFFIVFSSFCCWPGFSHISAFHKKCWHGGEGMSHKMNCVPKACS